MNDDRRVKQCRGVGLLLVLLLLVPCACVACQVAPLGSGFETRLTNEPDATLSRVANRLGRLIKRPVHEEITQLAFDCPVESGQLPEDETCAERDTPFANPFVIYGVRWNDLPPFRLGPREGRRCKKFLGGSAACNTAQTVRFATQPDCWYCLFTQAEKFTARGGKIVGCSAGAKGRGVVSGNLLSRSHYGDLQFLHAMATDDGVTAQETRQQILAWLAFAWQVSSGEIKPGAKLAAVEVPFIAERFACNGWSVSDLFILGYQDKMARSIRDVAFGSVLHTVQDSFSSSHVRRDVSRRGGVCAANAQYAKPAPIVEFHSYGSQDGHAHDAEDARTAMVAHVIDGQSEAVAMSRMLVDLYRTGAPWAEVKPYLDCILELADAPSVSSPGEAFMRPQGGE